MPYTDRPAGLLLGAPDAEMLRLLTLGRSRRLLDDATLAAQEEWFRTRSLYAFEVNYRGCAIAAYQGRIADLHVLP